MLPLAARGLEVKVLFILLFTQAVFAASGSIDLGSTFGGSSGSSVTAVTASSPLSSSGGTTPNISLIGIISIANGGTNSGAALSNNRVLQSSGGAIIEAVAITANRSLISDANGIPTQSITTATELSFVNGVTSAIQTQLNGKQASGSYVTSVTASSPLNSSGGTTPNLTCDIASGSQPGCLASASFTTFNNKEPAISSGTTLQYWRGDKSFQTLNTSVVPEVTNLYYTDARVQAIAKSGTSAQLFYVSKDAGSDANDCSILKPCQTIGAGLTAANAVAAYYKQAVLLVEPSNASTGYNENITLSQQGVNLVCSNPMQDTKTCVISGTVTVNLTGVSGGANFIAASNETSMNGFVVVTSGTNNALTFSGTTFQRLTITNCYIQSSSGAGSALSATNDATNVVKSTIRAYDTVFENNTAASPTISQTGGRVWLFGTQGMLQNDNAAGHSIDQSGASSFIANITTITGEVNVTSNTANTTLNLATVAAGTNPCVVTPSSPSTGIITLAYFGCTSTNTNSVTGSGVVVPVGASARLSSSGDIIATVTQAVVPGFPVGEQQLGAGAVTGTNVLLSMKGGHVKATQTTAPTAAVNANAGTGATCTVSNASDVAGAINLTTTAVSPAAGVQCTVTFNKAYGVAPICVTTPDNNNSILFSVANGSFFTTTTTTLVINYANADAVGHANVWSYHCMETQ